MQEVFTRTVGHGARKAFFAHCSLSSGKSLIPLMEHFAENRTMIAVDLPGQGKSAMPDMDRDYQTQCIEACIELIENSGWPQDLVGHSFGATVLLRLAFLRPDLVRSLVLFEPVYFSLLYDVEGSDFAKHRSSEKTFEDAIAAGDMLGAAEAFLTRWGLPGEWDAMPDTAKHKMAERMWVIPAQHKAIMEDNDERLQVASLRKITCPTLVLHGRESPPVMASLSEVIAKGVPEGISDVVEGAGHMLPITHAAICARKVQEFWDSDLLKLKF